MLGRFLHAAHFTAGSRTTTANLGAAFHLFATDTVARLGTCIANIGASRTDSRMHIGIAGHKIGGGLANFNAISHKLDVFFFNMLATCRQTVIEQRFLTFRAAFPAKLDAILHTFMIVVHNFLPLNQLLWQGRVIELRIKKPCHIAGGINNA